jgi:Fe-S-cluster-containing dehydrogenase component/CRP-like cAMP-binding protein
MSHALPAELEIVRGLDARGLAELEAAASARRLARGEVLYREGDRGEVLYVVLRGAIAVDSPRQRREARAHRAGATLGHESSLRMPRRGTAVAIEDTELVELPAHLVRRAALRAGGEGESRVDRSLKRAIALDLLRGTALGAEVDERELEALVDASNFEEHARKTTLFQEGDPSTAIWVVADGLVQLQQEREGRLHVLAYFAPGDLLGDEELAHARPRVTSAICRGPTQLLAIPSRALRPILARHPELGRTLRRVALGLADDQRDALAAAARGATAHAFRDLYRMRVASSLLVIDLDACVRCGHCSWACGARHGASRLVRRGERLVSGGAAPPEGFDVFRSPLVEHARPEVATRNLLVPSSCQHCENPACMIECPTGAIGRAATGEVVIDPALCTGCGACVRACPWDNVTLAPRPAEAPRPAGLDSPALATKCDLCHGFDDGPACVSACPVDAVARIHPASDLAEVAAFVGLAPRSGDPIEPRRAPAPPLHAPTAFGALLASLGLAVAGLVLHARASWHPARGPAWLAGVAAFALVVALWAYAWPKRVRLLRRARSNLASEPLAVVSPRTSRAYGAHLALGALLPGIVFLHAVPSIRGGVGSAAALGLGLAAGLGLALAAGYTLVPRRLARIERKALLPEDFGPEREALEARFYRALSGKSDLLKTIADRALVPYARAKLGPLALIASGRDLRTERERLASELRTTLGEERRARLAGLEELVAVAVELRALPAQRLLLGLLRVGLPLHVVALAAGTIALLVHVAYVVAREGGAL